MRDTTLGEDTSRIRKGAGPEIMAALRNAAIGTDHENRVSFDPEAGSAMGCRTVCDAIGAYTLDTQHAGKREENRQSRDIVCSGLAWLGSAGQALELVESGVVVRCTANSSRRTAAGRKQDK